MKKCMIILVGILFGLFLTACHVNYNFDYDELARNVTRVELINYDKPEARIITDIMGNLQRRHLNFDFDQMERLETLDVAQHENFFEEFSDIWLLDHMRHYNSPNGIAILMYEENDYFIIFATNYVGRFNPEGAPVEYLGSGYLWELIERYFDYELE